MKKFTFIIAAIFISSMMLAQTFQANSKLAPGVNSQINEKAVVGTLQWCTEDITNGIGTDGAGTFACAAEFDATDLASYDGNYITKIYVGISDVSVVTSGKVAICTGTYDAPVIAYEQAATFADGWNEILLTVPYQIDAATPIFVAYEVVATGGFPLGFDDGPDVPKGNWIATGGIAAGFGHLSDLVSTLTYNCSIKAEINDEAGGSAIAASPSELQFLGYVGEGNPEVQTSTIQGIGLTEDIAVTVTGTFEISADDVTYGTTATIPSTGGTLYVKYIVGAAGQNLGEITLSSTGADNVTINLTGVTVDCTGAVESPYTEDFTTTEHTACWATFDANGDDSSWGLYWSNDEQTDLMYGYYYNATNAADDWLVSPEILVPVNGVIRFDYAVQDADYPEAYAVYVITGSQDNYAAGTEVLSSQTIDNTDFMTQEVDISSYSGQNVYIGIKATSAANMFLLWIDNFVLDVSSSITNNGNNSINVFPNPANNVINIANAENSSIVVLNMVGEVVATIDNASANQTIDISNLSDGTYFVRVNSEVFKINVVK